MVNTTGIDLDALGRLDPAARAGFLARLDGPARRLIARALREELGRHDPLAHLTWRQWLRAVASPYVGSGDYAPEHVEFWTWVTGIRPGVRPDPWLSLWPRGYAKSTHAELAVARLGAAGLRSYFLYLSHTQGQADDHVANIGAMITSDAFTSHYPGMGEVAVTKHGESKGWRRNRLRTASGFTVDALGLDASRRGARLEEKRPDGMVMDDIDDPHASAAVTSKNVRTITQSLIPALTPDKVIILAQNVVAPNSIAAQLGDGRLDMLGGAIHSGPFPLIEDMETERVDGRWRITGGRPRWRGWWSLDRATDQLLDMGMDAFILECQQDYSERPGAIWTKDEIGAHRVDNDQVPELDRVIVAVDPNKTGRSDDAGVVKIGTATLNGELHAYVLEDHSRLEAPSRWRDSMARSVLTAPRAATVVVEYAGLGEHAELTVKGAPLLRDFPVSVKDAKANLGKKDRARPVWRLYLDGRIHHVGYLPYLERQMTTWVPDEDPMSPGGIDALVHGITHLLIDPSGIPNIARGR